MISTPTPELVRLANEWSAAVDAHRLLTLSVIEGDLLLGLELAGAVDCDSAAVVGPWAYWVRYLGRRCEVARRPV